MYKRKDGKNTAGRYESIFVSSNILEGFVHIKQGNITRDNMI